MLTEALPLTSCPPTANGRGVSSTMSVCYPDKPQTEALTSSSTTTGSSSSRSFYIAGNNAGEYTILPPHVTDRRVKRRRESYRAALVRSLFSEFQNPGGKATVRVRPFFPKGFRGFRNALDGLVAAAAGLRDTGAKPSKRCKPPNRHTLGVARSSLSGLSRWNSRRDRMRALCNSAEEN